MVNGAPNRSKGAAEQPQIEGDSTSREAKKRGKISPHSQGHPTESHRPQGEPRQGGAGRDGGRKSQNREEDSRRFELRDREGHARIEGIRK